MLTFAQALAGRNVANEIRNLKRRARWAQTQDRPKHWATTRSPMSIPAISGVAGPTPRITPAAIWRSSVTRSAPTNTSRPGPGSTTSNRDAATAL